MSLVDAVKTCFAKYVTFSGRARRSEYWWWALFYLIVAVIFSGIGTAAHAPALGLVTILILLPTLAVTIRRLHDTNRSGWWILIGLIPIVGSIILLVFTVQDSTPGPNNTYGPNPKDA
jgi:uncharacterized membrane protein YhaH (DUF805 family)